MAIVRGNNVPTIRDVARFAKVSPQTVSRVLNTPDKVKEETRERVLATIEQLGYRRSPLAWALATRRSGAVGVIDSGSGVIGQELLLTATEVALRRMGYSPRVVVTHADVADELDDAFQVLRDEMVEGFIILGNTTRHVRQVFRYLEDAPTVLVASNEPAHGNVSTVAADQFMGSRQLMEHLKQRGPRIGMIAGPDGWLDSDARVSVWRELTPDPSGLYLRYGDWTAQSGFVAMQELLHFGVDAVFAGNDYMALGAIWACVCAGLRVPEDVAIAGFDDMPGADFANPPLTTVRQPFADVGSAAAELLDDLIKGGGVRSIVLPTELVIRNSTLST